MGQNSNSFVKGKFSGTSLTCVPVEVWPSTALQHGVHVAAGGECAQLALPVLLNGVSKYQTPGALPDLGQDSFSPYSV